MPHGNAALQQEGTDLIDGAGPLADQPLPHSVQHHAQQRGEATRRARRLFSLRR
jgi:hypothetical protein